MKIRHSDIIIKAIQLTKCHHVYYHVAMYIRAIPRERIHWGEKLKLALGY